MPTNWQNLIASRGPSPFGVTLVKDGRSPTELLSPATTSRARVDESAMAVTCVLTTPDPDRQGDVVEPSGADFAEHRLNPVVLFHHGKGGHLPVGKAEDPRGNYTVRLVPGTTVVAGDGKDRLVGTTYFSQRDRFAADVFGLVAEDILRGVSIGFDPKHDAPGRRNKSVEILGDSPTLDRPAMRFKAWTLLEYSHTPIGVNREALTVAVAKALDGSRSIHPKLLKYLTPLAAPRKAVVAASYPTRVSKAMPQPPMPPEDDEDEGLFAADHEGGDEAGLEKTDDGGEMPPPDAGGDDVPPPDDAAAEAGPEAGGPTVGVKALLDGAQSLLDIADGIHSASLASEHVGVRKRVAKLKADLHSTAQELVEFAHATDSELKAASGDGMTPDDDGDEMPPEEGDEEPDGDEMPDESEGDDELPDEDEDGPPVKKGLVLDDSGAIVFKGYAPPRRLTAADLAAHRPAPVRKAKPAPDDDEDPDVIRVNKSELDAYIRETNLRISDLEAAARRRDR